MEWLTELSEWIKEVLIESGPALQNAWATTTDIIGTIVRHPEPVAIGLATVVLVLLLALLIGRWLLNRSGHRSFDDGLPESDFDDDSRYDIVERKDGFTSY